MRNEAIINSLPLFILQLVFLPLEAKFSLDFSGNLYNIEEPDDWEQKSQTAFYQFVLKVIQNNNIRPLPNLHFIKFSL